MNVLKNFVVIEGIDGSGTSTLQKNLVGKFNDHHRSVYKTCEPTDYPTGKLIRSVLNGNVKVPHQSLALLFAADRYNHLYNDDSGLVEIAKTQTILCDRYFFSSLAYQSLNTTWDWVLELNSQFPLPEKLIFVGIEAEIARNRVKSRDDDVEIFDELTLQQRISQNYARIMTHFSQSPMKILTLDGEDSPEALTDKAWDFIDIQ